jgi:hypothetical protein
MFEDLNWTWAARRSAVVIGIYVALLYVLSTVSPGRFGSVRDPAQIRMLLFNAIIFFFIFTFVYAFVDRSRRRRMAETSKKGKQARPAVEDSEAGPGSLKGRPNPNTSRKKARRRR